MNIWGLSDTWYASITARHKGRYGLMDIRKRCWPGSAVLVLDASVLPGGKAWKK
jgi:hypothetical protein